MMGNDVERILTGINLVKEAATSSINSLSSTVAYQLISDATHGGLSTTPCAPEEVPVPSSASGFVSPIRSAMSSISSDYGKMNTLAGGLFTSVNSFNNNYGSPWTELNKLEEAIKSAESFAAAHDSLNWVGEKAGLLGLLNSILSLSIDAKWALTYYHDYIQRGYDNIFNGNIPSIKTFTGLKQQSNGNVAQQFDENVHIPEESIDPF